MKLFAISVLTIGCVCDAMAAGITITKVADTDMAIPEGHGNFTRFDWPSLDDGNLVFMGRGSDDQRGIYRFNNGSIEKVVDKATTLPDGSTLFIDAKWPAIDDATVSFMGRAADGRQGVYRFGNGEITAVADSNTQLPDGSGSFTTFGPPFIEDGKIAFEAENDTGQGIYIYDDENLRTVADTSTQINAGAETFQRFSGRVQLDDGIVLFPGDTSTGAQGIYVEVDGQLSSVVDNSVAGLRAVAGFSSDNGSVVFRGIDDSGSHGLYNNEIVSRDSLRLIADADLFNRTLDGGFSFGRNIPATDNGSVAFWANTSDGETGIFLLRHGEFCTLGDHAASAITWSSSFLNLGLFSANGRAARIGFRSISRAIFRRRSACDGLRWALSQVRSLRSTSSDFGWSQLHSSTRA